MPAICHHHGTVASEPQTSLYTHGAEEARPLALAGSMLEERHGARAENAKDMTMTHGDWLVLITNVKC